MKISLVINCDTRPESNTNQKMFSGVVDRDFLIDGVLNKKKLFYGFDLETIVFVDKHEQLDTGELFWLYDNVDTLVIRKHNKEFEYTKDFAAFNDFNYIQALSQARGKYVFHFDGDIAAFKPSVFDADEVGEKPQMDAIWEMIKLLEQYDYVSYPSHWSPNPVDDQSFQNNYWVSTRFFCCKRETINISEIIKCQLDYDYWRTTYPRARLCHWLEHILQGQAKRGVIYPPIDYSKFILFTWESYRKGLLKELNQMTYEEVKNFVVSRGGIFYPNNLNA